MIERNYLIPMERFDNSEYIGGRVSTAPPEVAGSLRTTLKYLYMSSGPINLPRLRLKTSEPFITSKAGRLLVVALPASVQTVICSSLGSTTGVAARVGRNNQRALRRMCDDYTSGAMRYAYCTLR